MKQLKGWVFRQLQKNLPTWRGTVVPSRQRKWQPEKKPTVDNQRSLNDGKQQLYNQSTNNYNFKPDLRGCRCLLRDRCTTEEVADIQLVSPPLSPLATNMQPQEHYVTYWSKTQEKWTTKFGCLGLNGKCYIMHVKNRVWQKSWEIEKIARFGKCNKVMTLRTTLTDWDLMALSTQNRLYCAFKKCCS